MKVILQKFMILGVIAFFSFNYQDAMSQEKTDTLNTENLYEMSLEDLMNVKIVSASKKEESLFDAPLGASVITGEELRKSGVSTIMEGLRLLPGIIVRETTPGNFDIHMRGFDAIDPNGLITMTSNTITLIMINNRPIYSEFQGQTYWEVMQIGIADVEKIEVVRGPVSAMYGPNAVAGVINIITKKGNQKDGPSVNAYVQGGNPTAIIANAGIGYKLNNGFSIRGSGSYQKQDRHNIDYYIYSNKKKIGNTTPSSNNPFGYVYENVKFVEELDDSLLYASGTLVKDPGLNPKLNPINVKDKFPNTGLAVDKYAFNAHLTFTKKTYEINLMAGSSKTKTQKIYGMNNFSALTSDNQNNDFIHLFGNVKHLSFSADYQQGNMEINGSGEALKFFNSTINSNVEYNFDINEMFNLKPGISYKSSKYNSLFLGSKKIEALINRELYLSNLATNTEFKVEEAEGDKINSSISGYLRAEFNYEKLRIIGAVRADKFQYPNKIVYNPLIATTFKVTEDFLIRDNYGRASRTPFMLDLFTKIDLVPVTGLSYHYRGTENTYDVPGIGKASEYKLLTVDQAEVGFRHRISKTFTLDLEVFWSKLKNLSTLTQVASTMDSVIRPTGGKMAWRNVYVSNIIIDAEPTQTGATMSITSVPFDNVMFQIYLTIQETKVKKYYDKLDATGNAVDGTDADNDKYKEFYNQATPHVFGGVNFNYQATSKLNLNINSYYYTHQVLSISNGANATVVEQTDANVIVNMTLNYELIKGGKLFVTGRNLLGFDEAKRQYAFADKIGGSIMGGFSYNF